MTIATRFALSDSDATAIGLLRGPGTVPDCEQLVQYILAVEPEPVALLCDTAYTPTGGRIVGCVRVRKVSFYQAELMHLMVREDMRGQGIGRLLVLAALRRATELKLPYTQCTVRADNYVMRALLLCACFERGAIFQSPVSPHTLVAYSYTLPRSN